MSRALAVLRPEPGWSRTAAKARGMKLEVIGHPLFDAEPIAWSRPVGEFDALLAGSGSPFRVGGPQLADLRGLPVHAVGASTAEAAEAAGFRVSAVGVAGLQQILDAAAGQSVRFLRLGGEERVPVVPHDDQTVTECAVYRMVARPLDPGFALALASRRPLVALHSAAAARHFSHEVDRLGIERGTLFLLVLGKRIAKAAGLGWAALHVAETPDDAALLVKAAALCK